MFAGEPQERHVPPWVLSGIVKAGGAPWQSGAQGALGNNHKTAFAQFSVFLFLETNLRRRSACHCAAAIAETSVRRVRLSSMSLLGSALMSPRLQTTANAEAATSLPEAAGCSKGTS